jgi:hypothetical protein
MACWIRSVVIVTNNGTILFGNADILPIIGKDNTKDTEESDQESDSLAGDAAAEGADVAAVRRNNKRKRGKRSR